MATNYKASLQELDAEQMDEQYKKISQRIDYLTYRVENPADGWTVAEGVGTGIGAALGAVPVVSYIYSMTRELAEDAGVMGGVIGFAASALSAPALAAFTVTPPAAVGYYLGKGVEYALWPINRQKLKNNENKMDILSEEYNRRGIKTPLERREAEKSYFSLPLDIERDASQQQFKIRYPGLSYP